MFVGIKWHLTLTMRFKNVDTKKIRTVCLRILVHLHIASYYKKKLKEFLDIRNYKIIQNSKFNNKKTMSP